MASSALHDSRHTNVDAKIREEERTRFMSCRFRARELFFKSAASYLNFDDIQRVKIESKLRSEYGSGSLTANDTPAENDDAGTDTAEKKTTDKLQEAINHIQKKRKGPSSTAIVAYQKTEKAQRNALIPMAQSRALALRRRATKVPTPPWHAPWKLYRVISGHLGWVRCVDVDPTNNWFVTGANDRTIKVWDLASGKLKLTLTGHVHNVRGLKVSPRHPYLFSAGEDKQVKCWDLETNKVIRYYHGHLSGVYCLDIHPTIDVIVTGGRDCCARVWDIRTKHQIFVLGGHRDTVVSLACQGQDPQIVTGSMDQQIKLWDLKTGKARVTLTNHKKSIRSLCLHPREFRFASAAPDNIKKWDFPDGKFIKNFSGHNTILHSLSINDDDVMVSCGDNGSLKFWDWNTGYNFQTLQTRVQPGSMDSEAGIMASCFDKSGRRLITTECDKTIKIYKEDEDATPETHPVDMRSWTTLCRKRKRY